MASRLQEYLMQQPLYGAGLRASQEGTSMAPVRSPWEGLARALQGGLGGLMQGYGLERARGAETKDDTALAAYMANPNDPALAAAAANHPSFPTVATARMGQEERAQTAKMMMEERRQRAEEANNTRIILAHLIHGGAAPQLATNMPGEAPPPSPTLTAGLPVTGPGPQRPLTGPPVAAPPAPGTSPVPQGPVPMPAPAPAPTVPLSPTQAPDTAGPPPPTAPPGVMQGDAPSGMTRTPVPVAPGPAAPVPTQLPEGAPSNLPPKPQGQFWNTDPTLYGYQQYKSQKKRGGPMEPETYNGQFAYFDPNNPKAGLVFFHPDRQKQYTDVMSDDGKTVIAQRGPGGELRPVNIKPPSTTSIPAEVRDLHGADFTATPYFQNHPNKNNVMGLVEGRLKPSDLTGRSQDKNQMIEMAQQLDSTYTPSDADALRRFRTVYMGGEGTGGKTVIAVNTAVDHMKQFHDIMNIVANGQAIVPNAVTNYIKTQFGVPDVTNAQAARQILATEIVRTVKGGQPMNEPEQKAANDILNPNSSPAQTQGALNTLTGLMMGRVHNLQDFAKSKGVTDKETNGYIFPRSQESLEYMQKNPIGSKQTEGAIPQKAIDMLKADPGSRGHFDTIFGPGSAAKILGQ